MPKPQNDRIDLMNSRAVSLINGLFAAEIASSHRPNVIERAFALARSGMCRAVSDVRKTLSKEVYLDARSQLDGRFIKRQLADLIAASR